MSRPSVSCVVCKPLATESFEFPTRATVAFHLPRSNILPGRYLPGYTARYHPYVSTVEKGRGKNCTGRSHHQVVVVVMLVVEEVVVAVAKRKPPHWIV